MVISSNRAGAPAGAEGGGIEAERLIGAMTAMGDEEGSMGSDADMGWLSDDSDDIASEMADTETRRDLSGAASSSGADPTSSPTHDEDEPTLEYRQLGVCVSSRLTDDVASCARAKDGLFALGTKSGRVNVFSHSGDFCAHLARLNKPERLPHYAPVSDVSFDAHNEHVASCSFDGTVAVVRLGEGQMMNQSNPNPKTNSKIVFVREHDAPVLAVALDPKETDARRRVVCGLQDGRVLMETFTSSVEDNFTQKVSKHKTPKSTKPQTKPNEVKTIHKGEGPVRCLAWSGVLLAWSNDVGVKIYDTSQNKPVAIIDRPRGSPAADKYKCNLVWDGDATLLIGWADCVKIVKIGLRDGNLNWQRGGSNKGSGSTGNRITSSDSSSYLSDVGNAQNTSYAEVVSMFQTDFAVAGIAPFGNDNLLLLAFIETNDDEDLLSASIKVTGRRPSKRPEVRVITRAGKYEVVARDALGVEGYEQFKHEDYTLAFSMRNSENKTENISYFLASPRSVVCLRPRTTGDKIKHLVARNEFELALELCDTSSDDFNTQTERTEIVEAYLEHMLTQCMNEDSNDSGQNIFTENIAQSSSRLLRTDSNLWERWLLKFLHCGNPNVLARIVPYIPTTAPSVLTPEAYEQVLHFLLAQKSQHSTFLATLKSWPSSLYGVKGIVAATRRTIRLGMVPHDSDSSFNPLNTHTNTLGTLREALAELYLADGAPERALRAHLALGRPTVLDFIERHDLLGLVARSSYTGEKSLRGVIDTGHGSKTKQTELASAVAPLALLNPERAVSLFVNRRDIAPPEFIATNLANANKFEVGCDGADDLDSDDPPAPTSLGSRCAREVYHLYLRALFDVDKAAVPETHVDAQVGLFAEFHPTELGSFLDNAQSIDLHKALDTVTKFENEAAQFVRDEEETNALNGAVENEKSQDPSKSFWRARRDLFARERAQLLSRLGATRRALRALIDLDDIEGAVALTHEKSKPDPTDPLDEGDDELWDELIELVTQRVSRGMLETQEKAPSYTKDSGDKESLAASAKNQGIRDLLDVAGKLVDPSRVLARVPVSAEIDGLRERLVNILAERRTGWLRARLARDTSSLALADVRTARVTSGKRAFRASRIVVED